DFAQDGVPIGVGQTDVEQDEVRPLLLDEPQAVGAGRGLGELDVAPLDLEAEPNRRADLGVIIDEQDLHAGAAPRGTTRWNVLPRPTSLSTSIVPPCAWAIANAVGRPIPAPPPDPSGAPTKNRSNSRAC